MPPATFTPAAIRAPLARRLHGLYAGLIVGNAAIWAWAALAFHHSPVLLGAALLAYSLGLRHAVDADHIAAIDNVTRALMQHGGEPITIGLWFSLGHSSIVLGGATAIAALALSLQHRWVTAVAVGGLVGTLISAGFLFAIAAANWSALNAVWRAFQKVRRGGAVADSDAGLMFAGPGVLTRLFRPVLGAVRRSRQMYWVGLLFGLGFDTATEVGVLGLAAAEAAAGLALWQLLVFPALFAAGMALIDSTDNVLMVGAYGWAFTKPLRKLYYNLTITSLSILVAAAVGAAELLGLAAGAVASRNAFWSGVRALNAHFSVLGYGIIALFALGWAVAIAIYRWRGFDELESISMH